MASRDARTANLAADVPRVAWDDFVPRFRWRQGEHVALVGPTGWGKTTLALQLLPLRSWSVILATKGRDKTLAGLKSEGYVTIPAWPPPSPEHRRVIVWPRFRDERDQKNQHVVLRDTVNAVMRSGSWCVFADDVQHLTSHLHLGTPLDTLWLQARSLDVSVLAATQRPRWVPRQMWTQSTHLFLWGTRDEEDIKSLSGFGGASAKLVRSIVESLDKYDVLYINKNDRRMAITRAERR